jgi:hypothetical protein
MMRTVAEAMIGANATVAERIGKAFPAAALLRRHPPPRAEAFAEVRCIWGLCFGGCADCDSTVSVCWSNCAEAYRLCQIFSWLMVAVAALSP